MGKVLVFCVVLIFLITLAYNVFHEEIEEKKKEVSDPRKPPDDIDDLLGAQHVQNLQRARRAGTLGDMHAIKTATVQYYTEKSQMPATLDDLVQAGYLSQSALKDPWDQRIRSEFKGREWILTSSGPDRIKNTSDDIVQTVPVQ